MTDRRVAYLGAVSLAAAFAEVTGGPVIVGAAMAAAMRREADAAGEPPPDPAVMREQDPMPKIFGTRGLYMSAKNVGRDLEKPLRHSRPMKSGGAREAARAAKRKAQMEAGDGGNRLADGVARREPDRRDGT